MGTDKNRRNFSIRQKVDDVLNEKSDEWDMSRSEIVEKAVLEYTDHDRTARVEEKVNEIHDAVVGGSPTASSQREEEKENPSDQVQDEDGRDSSVNDSDALVEKYSDGDVTVDLSEGPLPVTKDKVGNQTRRKANKMFNNLMLDEPGRVIPHDEVLEKSIFALETDNKHFRDQFEDRIKQRMEDAGWVYHSVNSCWYRDEQMYLNHLCRNWDELKNLSQNGRLEWGGTDPKEDIKKLLDASGQFQQELLDYDVAEKSEVQSAFDAAETRFENLLEKLQ